ncbi:hypothetical protein ADIARSV_4031 [Arcticibacter svalbardensis MN12-7]|uniref:Uncharacterized protein n=1 Tax=Arcticibacter svalbardensis MN12-7 TaxID=1150600 RepID=R9GV02_9SPHI|nr:hypothetical protein ADIARSV_4031 [Arcticibacter svalbardensis MN12-7]
MVWDNLHLIKRITFENLRINAKLILDGLAGNIKAGENTENIKF